MKKFNITVNGTVYEVVVEEVNVSNETPAPVPKAVESKPEPKIESKPAPAPAAKSSSGKEGALKILAPMPSTIIKIAVEAGQKVKKDDLLLVFEAMKMENELVAPQDGIVVSVNTSKGTAVNSGDLLLTIE